MTHIDELLARNKAFASTDVRDRAPAIPFIPIAPERVGEVPQLH